jgi:hypothetical protein
MSVAVYSRLGELLAARNLTVAELSDQIASRYGLVVDPESLRAWVRDTPVQQADLELAGATAAILDVSLADLFDVNAVPDLAEVVDVLDTPDADRMSELLELQQSRQLSEAEANELSALVAENNRRIVERQLKSRAKRQGISVEQARRELETAVAEASRRWQEFQSNPQLRRSVVSKLRRRSRKSTTLSVG